MVNGLAQERSAYLRQHRTNPVNWLPWGEAALSAAKTFDKPMEHRLLGLPLVPCDGPGELRASRDRRVDEPSLRQHQSGSRRAARSRRALPQGPADDGP